MFISSPLCQPFIAPSSLCLPILILQPEVFITSYFFHITELFECVQEALRKEKTLIGTGPIKPRDVAGSRELSER